MRVFLAGTVLLVSFAIAGCGGGGSSSSSGGNGEASKPAQQVLADATKAADSASSFHISGQVNTNGQQIGLDLSIVKGQGAIGSITLKGQKIEIVVVGSDAYMKAGAVFWTQYSAAAAHLFAGRWIKFSTTDPRFKGFTTFTKTPLPAVSKWKSVTNKGTTTYKGQSVVNLFNSTKGGSLYVAANGTAYPVAVVKTGADGGAVTFGNWNQSVTLTAPSGAVDFSQLGGG